MGTHDRESDCTGCLVGRLTNIRSYALLFSDSFNLSSKRRPYTLRIVSRYVYFDLFDAFLAWTHNTVRDRTESRPGRFALIAYNMPILSRLPNIISSSLSSTPQEPSQKSQIGELVQKTRTLELTISRLREQLSDSRSERQAERKEWAGECETVMGFHRIAHLQTNVILAQERVALEHERDRTRKERVAVIERNYYLTLSRAKEKELEIELKEKEYLINDAEKAREAAEVR